jgi:hypothetical protein
MPPASFLNWLGSLPLDVALILVVLPTVLFAMLGTLVIRAVFGGSLNAASSVGPSKNQVAAEIYAVVLGFIVVYGFSEFNEAKQNVLKEAATLSRLVAQAPLAGEDASRAIVAAVRDYSQIVAVKEWPLMASGGESPEAEASLHVLEKAIFSGGGASDNLVKMRFSTLLDEVVARRVDRLSAAPNPDLSNIIFELLLVGACLAVMTGWFLRGPSIVVHLILVAMITSSVVTMMILSAQLLYPFSGPVSISPQPFLALAAARAG